MYITLTLVLVLQQTTHHRMCITGSNQYFLFAAENNLMGKLTRTHASTSTHISILVLLISDFPNVPLDMSVTDGSDPELPVLVIKPDTQQDPEQKLEKEIEVHETETSGSLSGDMGEDTQCQSNTLTGKLKHCIVTSCTCCII